MTPDLSCDEMLLAGKFTAAIARTAYLYYNEIQFKEQKNQGDFIYGEKSRYDSAGNPLPNHT